MPRIDAGLLGPRFSSASSAALAFKVSTDSQYRINVDAGGTITWGDGSTAGDTNLYRSAANILKTDDVFEAAGGVITLAYAGTPIASLADGALAVDTTNNKFYFRSGSTWREVTGSGGLPTGGDTGNIPYKLSATNYDVGWASSITLYDNVADESGFTVGLTDGVSNYASANLYVGIDPTDSYSELILQHVGAVFDVLMSDTTSGSYFNMNAGSTRPAYINISGSNPEYRVNGTTVTEVATFTVSGALITGTGQARWYAPRAIKIKNVQASVGTAPTGSSVIFDVNKNGTTVFTTQGNRPTIAVSTNSDLTAVPDVTSVSAGDYLTIDIDQIGSTVAGSNAVVQIEYYPV